LGFGLFDYDVLRTLYLRMFTCLWKKDGVVWLCWEQIWIRHNCSGDVRVKVVVRLSKLEKIDIVRDLARCYMCRLSG